MEKYLPEGIKEAEQSQFPNRGGEDARADPDQAIVDWRNICQLPDFYFSCDKINDWLFSSSLESNNQFAIANSLAPIAANVSAGLAPLVAITPNQTNLSACQGSQVPSTSTTAFLKRSFSELCESDQTEKRRDINRKYREKCRRVEEETKLNLALRIGENESLKKENESIKKDNALMSQTLTGQVREIYGLKNTLFRLKREYDKQNVLVQRLSGLLGDPVQLENEKLKEENALLRMNANNLPLLVKENADLRLENKGLKRQRDALCGKVISDNKNRHEEENAAKMPSASMFLRTKSSLL